MITVLKSAVAAIVRIDDRLRFGGAFSMTSRVRSESGVKCAEERDVGAGCRGFAVEQGLEAAEDDQLTHRISYLKRQPPRGMTGREVDGRTLSCPLLGYSQIARSPCYQPLGRGKRWARHAIHSQLSVTQHGIVQLTFFRVSLVLSGQQFETK